MIARRYNAPVLGYVEPRSVPEPELCFTRKIGRPQKQKQKAEIRALRRAGMKTKDIAKMYGVTPQRISTICCEER